ncbi:small ribosomal subunit Rsm22 family protein [Streptomyces sp. NPDC005438]|uniref:small ribosomal subunit Rsm22 family protein n=1 Tax=Streptomyces sp. NPDC005438 TaxID=3156880 RepID=UPI0033A41253
MTEHELRAGLATLLDGLPPRRLSAAVDGLIATYRGRIPTDAPVLRDRADVTAYAAYRMPATFAAVAASLRALSERWPDWHPASHLDVGGGTGAGVWAAASVWPDEGEPSTPRRTTVLDWAEPALDLGRELAQLSEDPAVRGTRWERRPLHAEARQGEQPLPEAVELATVSYVLGELPPASREALVTTLAQRATALVVVEPGTPDGYLRVRAARELMVRAGLRVVAPCPHSEQCPIDPLRGATANRASGDWCHFATRVSRSSLHRKIKDASMAWEDEKFSFVAAVNDQKRVEPAPARIVRKPQLRKGQVLLDLCARDDGLTRRTVSKRQGGVYRDARNAAWGQSWPPPQD